MKVAVTLAAAVATILTEGIARKVAAVVVR
jgi:hypothetical protein